MGHLTGLGKVSETILNKIADVTGTLYEPTQIRRVGSAKADAEAEMIIKRTEADITATRLREQSLAILHVDPPQDDQLGARAAKRLVTQEVTRQGNLEKIVHESL